jgi:hypothetical protein
LYKKIHHSDALLHRYFDEVLPKKPYSLRKLVLTISLVLLCVLPLFFAGAFFVLSRPAWFIHDRQIFENEVVGS